MGVSIALHSTPGVRSVCICDVGGPARVSAGVRPMQDPRFIILSLIAAACIAAPISVICSRRRVFEAWAKVASILICVLGLGWTALAFSLIRMDDAASGPIGVILTHARILVGGVCIGLVLAILIARPYKKVTIEES